MILKDAIIIISPFLWLSGVCGPHLLLQSVCIPVNFWLLSSESPVESRLAPLSHTAPSLLWADKTDGSQRKDKSQQTPQTKHTRKCIIERKTVS